MTLDERLIGILSGKIPNRLTYEEIKEGMAYVVDGILILNNTSSWVRSINKRTLRPDNVHYWMNVLLFIPLKQIPVLINNPDGYVRSAARYRLKVGK